MRRTEIDLTEGRKLEVREPVAKESARVLRGLLPVSRLFSSEQFQATQTTPAEQFVEEMGNEETLTELSEIVAMLTNLSAPEVEGLGFNDWLTLVGSVYGMTMLSSVPRTPQVTDGPEAAPSGTEGEEDPLASTTRLH